MSHRVSSVTFPAGLVYHLQHHLPGSPINQSRCELRAILSSSGRLASNGQEVTSKMNLRHGMAYLSSGEFRLNRRRIQGF